MKKLFCSFSGIISLFMFADMVSADNSFFGDANDIVQCGNIELPLALPNIIRTIINLFKIVVPIILIIIGMIDITKAVIASDEKDMSKSKDNFFKRLIARAIVFLLLQLYNF